MWKLQLSALGGCQISNYQIKSQSNQLSLRQIIFYPNQYQNQRFMRQKGIQSINQLILDQCGVSGLFYEPLAQQNSRILIKEIVGIQPKGVFSKILNFNDEEILNTQHRPQIRSESNSQNQNLYDQNLLKIIQRKKVISQQRNLQTCREKAQFYSFNYDSKESYNQTPIFKCLLQTPLKNFLKKYQFKIAQLSNSKSSKQNFQQVKKNQNPNLYRNSPSAYFVGIAIGLQKENLIQEALFFFILACYAEPFNNKIWTEIISFCKKVGLWEDAFKFSKTAFLFLYSSQFADAYYLCGDKCEMPASQMRGLLSSLKYPQRFQKVLCEAAKYQIKYRKLWRGLGFIIKYYTYFNYKIPFFPALYLGAKCLQGLGLRNEALIMLQKMFRTGVNQILPRQLYIETRIRNNQGIITHQDLKIFQQLVQNLTNEIKYRLCLNIAEYFLRLKLVRLAQQYIIKAFNSATKYVKNGLDRIYREIYFTVIPYQCLEPSDQLTAKFCMDDHLIFMSNRRKFILGQKLTIYKFSNWKYYLHYALDNNLDFLIQIYEENQQPRIIAEAIHFLRLKKHPLVMLKYWRSMIKQSFKSGQLWCEGGRIYADLGEKKNAIKCFKFALHFTPQYGDSFLELLKIYLQDSNYIQVNQLRKNFEVSEPFYGNAFCFLQAKYSSYFKVSLRQIWQRSLIQIESFLYNKNNEGKPQLTASEAYNEAIMNHQGVHNAYIRQLLFNSYEKIDKS